MFAKVLRALLDDKKSAWIEAIFNRICHFLGSQITLPIAIVLAGGEISREVGFKAGLFLFFTGVIGNYIVRRIMQHLKKRSSKLLTGELK